MTWRTFERQANLGLELRAPRRAGALPRSHGRSRRGAVRAGALLVDWLNDLLFLAETGFAFSAATNHGLEVVQAKGDRRARVILDV